MHSIDADDFSGKPSYQSLANEYIELPLRIRYKPVTVDGQRVGVFEIGDSQDRPYMMRIDYSEKLRRGDAYVRVKNGAMKMGRRQLAETLPKVPRDRGFSDRTPDEIAAYPSVALKDDSVQVTSKIGDLRLRFR